MNNFENQSKTFETRLQFIRSVFSNVKHKDDILKSSIEFKLNKSYEEYLYEVSSSLNRIIGNSTDEKAIKILKKIVKE